ncbi:MAG: response regulator [Nitrospinae bacterium]|nr:response regulator [Nitrospinota bacterium]
MGKGSRFIFTAQFGIGEETSPFLIEKLKNMRVLIVDDNSSAREVFTHILLGFGMRPDTAEDGMVALAKLREAEEENDCYKLVLLDWNMPGMDGIETARYIREKGGFNEIPSILMVTAYGQEEVSGLLTDVGIGHLLTKPVNESILHDTIVESLLNDEITELRKDYRQKVKKENKGLTTMVGANILLVEDSPLNREVAIEFLKEARVNVDIATNGREAVEKVKAGNYNLVLMDIQMPEMDGITATKLIRSDKAYKDLPIIAMTAHAMVGDREKSIEAGMNDHVTKPIDPEILFETLDKWIKIKTGESKPEKKTEKPEEPDEFIQLDGIDTKIGLKTNMNNKELYLRIMRMFQTEFGDAASRLNVLIESGDIKEAHRVVHTIKSASASIGALELSKIGQEVEYLLADSKIELPLIERLKKELERILVSLQNLPSSEETAAHEENNSQEKIKELFDTLERFLSKHDSEAETVIEKVSKLNIPEEIKNKVSELNELIEDIEYERALLLLKEIKKEL